jgi:hypothetical protein
MWSLTSPSAKRISGPRNFRWSAQKDFCNTIPPEADIVRLSRRVRFVPILLRKSAVTDDVVRPFYLGRRGLAPDPGALYATATATQYTEHEQVAVVQPAMRAAVGSEQWRPERTHPGRLVGHAVEVDRASECVSSARTASRSFCAHVATARSSRCQRMTGQRPGHAHGYRAGSCVMVPLGSIAV